MSGPSRARLDQPHARHSGDDKFRFVRHMAQGCMSYLKLDILPELSPLHADVRGVPFEPCYVVITDSKSPQEMIVNQSTSCYS